MPKVNGFFALMPKKSASLDEALLRGYLSGVKCPKGAMTIVQGE